MSSRDLFWSVCLGDQIIVGCGVIGGKGSGGSKFGLLFVEILWQSQRVMGQLNCLIG